MLSTAKNLFDHGIRPIVLASYSTSNGGEASHEATKICLNRLIGKHYIIERELDTKEDITKLLDDIKEPK